MNHFAQLQKFCAAAFFFAALLPSLPAQSTSGNLVGTVVDNTGSAVPNATVDVLNPATGVKFTSRTNTRGEYRTDNLLVGRYSLTATANGFAAATIRDFEIQLNRTATANFTLQVGQVSTAVDVRESAATIDTTTSQIQNTFSGEDARNNPLASVSNQGVLNFSLLSAGVTSSGGVGYGDGPSVGGQRPTNNNFNIEGVDNNDKGVTGPIVNVPNDAVGQFSLLQNQFSPEFGFSSGGIFNTSIRSGTNALHGTLYEYLQNRKLDAVDQRDARQGFSQNPRFDNNRLGANIGGPIRKNKLFYFADFEYNPIGQNSPPAGQIFAPTAAGYSTLGNLAGSGAISKTNLGVLQQFLPAAQTSSKTTNVAGADIPIGAITINSPNFSNQYNLVTAGDWNISQNDQFRLRYIYNKYAGIDTNASLPVFFSPVPLRNHLAALSEFHNFSPSLTNELRLSFNRKFNDYPIGNFTFPGLDAFPNIIIDQDLNLQLGPDSNSPQGYVQNTYQISDNVTKILGRHTIKFGYDFHDIIASNTFVQRARGDYNYSKLDLFLRDVSPNELGERSVGTAGGIPVGFLQHAVFVNDDFRLNKNLTVNLGLRYEYVTVPVVSRAQQYSALADLPGFLTFRKPDSASKDFAPRIGVAYSPGNDGKTVIRAGFGMSYDQFYNNLSINAKPPFYQQTKDVPDLNGATPGFLAGGGLNGTVPPPPSTTAAARSQVSSYTFDQTRPYSLTWTAGFQRVIANDYTFEARYTGTRGVHLQVQEQLNRYSKVNASNYIPTFLTTPSTADLAGLRTFSQINSVSNNPYAASGFTSTITAYSPTGNSSYHGLALQLTRRFTRDLSFTGSYTWSHNIDDSTATVFSTTLTPRRGQDFQNRSADKASSALDRRQRFTLALNYAVLPFKNRGYLLKNVVGNWNVSGIYTYETPEYATVQSGADSNLNGDSAGDRVILNLSGPANSSSDTYGINAQGQRLDKPGDPTTVAYVAVNPNARYIKANPGALANAGRNTLPLLPIDNLNLSLSKNVTITERLHLQFGGQFDNALNHAQYFPGYLSDILRRSFTSSRNFLIPGNPDFGKFDRYFPSNSRTGQVYAKFFF